MKKAVMGSVFFVSVAVADVQMEGIEIQASQLPIQERKDASIAKRVVSSEELGRYGDLNMLDILRRLPGVNIPESARGKSQPGKGYTKVLIEGEEVSTSSRRKPSPLEQLSPDMIEKVEIMTNGSAEHTAEAMGGIVNIILKSPASDSKMNFKAGVGFSKERLSENLFVQQEGKYGKISYLFNTTLSETRRVEPSSIHTEDTLGYRDELMNEKWTDQSATINSRIVYTPGVSDKYTFDGTVSAGNSSVHSDELRYSNGALVPDRQILSTEDGRSTMLWAKLRGEHHLSDSELFEWRIKAHQNSQSADSITSISGVETSQDDETLFRLFGAEGSYSKLYENHFFKTGYELKRLDQKENLVTSTDPYQELYLKETRNSLYFQDEINWGDSMVWTPGIRYENVSRDFSQSAHFSYFAPSLHMLYKFSENDHLRSSIAKTVKLPRLNELSTTIDRSLDQNDLTHPDIAGNPNLKEESAWSGEIRFEHYNQDRGIVSVGGFYRKISDKIEKLTLLEATRYVERPYNSGTARLWGIETELKKSLSGYVEGLNIHANATFQNSLLDTGTIRRPIKETPNYFYTVGVDHSLKPYRLSYGASYRYTGRYDDPIDERGVFETAQGYGALDLYTSKRFTDQSKISLNVKNLFAEDMRVKTGRYSGGVLTETQDTAIERPIQLMITYEKKW